MGNATCIRIRANFPRYPWNITPKAKNSTSRIGFDPQPALPNSIFHNSTRLSIYVYVCVRVCVCVCGGGIIIGEFLEPNTLGGTPFILMTLIIATRIDTSNSCPLS